MTVGDVFERVGLRVHEALYKGSGGRIGHRVILVPTLLLTTTGRRTGRRRTSALIYARDGGDFVVVASNHGEDTDPGWLHNVREHPEVGLQVGRRTGTGRARIVGRDDPDYGRLWALVNRNNHDRYTGYQRRTMRPIPLVIITPESSWR